MPGRPGALRVPKDVALELRDRKLTFEPFEITGEGTQLAVRGSVGLSEAHAIDVSVSGPFDPALLSVSLPEIGLTGRFRVALAATGTLSAPILTGELRVENGKYRVRGDVADRGRHQRHRPLRRGRAGAKSRRGPGSAAGRPSPPGDSASRLSR